MVEPALGENPVESTEGCPPAAVPPSRLLPIFALFTIYVVWGSTYLAIRFVVREMPPLLAGGFRFLVAGTAMAAAAFVTYRRRTLPSLVQIRDYAIVGLLLLGGANGLVMTAEKQVPSGIASLIVATTPLWIAFFDGLRPKGQPWTLRVWIGLFVGLIGVALLVRPSGGDAPLDWLSVGELLVASLLWSAGAIYSQSITEKLPMLWASAIEMIAGSAALLVGAWILGQPLDGVLSGSFQAWAGLLYLTVIGSLVGFSAFTYALDNLPASTVGTYAYVNPLVAVALGHLVLSEPLSPGLVAGAALIVAGVLVSTLRVGRARA